MTTDSRNYSGPNAKGAVLLPGRNAAGVPQTPGPNAKGADCPPLQTMPASRSKAEMMRLSTHAMISAGPTDWRDGDSTNETLAVDTETNTAYNTLDSLRLGPRGPVIVYPPLAFP